MADYSGYFLKGLSSGISSGFNMGTQIQEMQWQKAQRKKAEAEKAKYEEGMATIGSIIKQCSADGVYSEDDELKIMTSFWASIPEVQAVYQDLVNSIQTINKGKFEEDMKWLELTLEQAEGLDWKNAQSIFDYTKGRITTEKGRNYFTAYESISKKRHEAMPTDISRELDITGKLPEEYKYPYMQEQGLVGELTPTPTPAKPTDTQVKLAEVDKLGFLTEERRNAMKVNILAGDSATTEKVNAIRAAGGTDADILEAFGAGVQGVNPPTSETVPETVSTLKSWETMFDIKGEEGPKTEEEYNRALDLLAQSRDKYKPKYANWKEALVAEVKTMAKELEALSKDKSTKGKENFGFALNIYMQKLEEIKAKYPEVDLSQFPEFKKQQSLWQKILERGKYSK